jgi:hypothetical protein
MRWVMLSYLFCNKIHILVVTDYSAIQTHFRGSAKSIRTAMFLLHFPVFSCCCFLNSLYFTLYTMCNLPTWCSVYGSGHLLCTRLSDVIISNLIFTIHWTKILLKGGQVPFLALVSSVVSSSYNPPPPPPPHPPPNLTQGMHTHPLAERKVSEKYASLSVWYSL